MQAPGGPEEDPSSDFKYGGWTAPYFRDGQAATLDDVIDFYDRGGDPAGSFLGGPKEIRPLHLAAREKAALKAFLRTLTGRPIPARGATPWATGSSGPS